MRKKPHPKSQEVVVADLLESTQTTNSFSPTPLVDATKNSWAQTPTQTNSADTANFNYSSQHNPNIVEEGIRD